MAKTLGCAVAFALIGFLAGFLPMFRAAPESIVQPFLGFHCAGLLSIVGAAIGIVWALYSRWRRWFSDSD